MGSKYVDISAIMQVIGGIYINPSLLDDEKYFFNEEDFTEEFHKIVFGSIFNLHELGAKTITPAEIENYLEARPKKFSIYQVNRGNEYLEKLKENTQIAAFNYYYSRMKKMSLLRAYNQSGLDVSWLYDPDNIFDSKKKQSQEEWLDNTPIEDIADLIDKKILTIRTKYVDDTDNEYFQAGDGINELLERLKLSPEYGYPLYGRLINTICRGARLGKFYLRSSSTGTGKSRTMIADSCNFACDLLYDSEKQEWIDNGTKEPTLYITTEQELEEIQTMMLSFIADVDEEHILNNEYYEGERERILKAAEILKNSPIYVKELPDFSLQDIENTIKLGIREYKVKYVLLDYIHSSMKILSEVTTKAKVKNLREDNVLFMISIRLKDLCKENNIFILSSTQLNGEYQNARIYDQNLLRGAKAIADKVDYGCLMLEVNKEDMEGISDIVSQLGCVEPKIKMPIYKNRRGRYKGIILWCEDRRATCKVNPLFATDYNYQLIDIPDLKIKVKPRKDVADEF